MEVELEREKGRARVVGAALALRLCTAEAVAGRRVNVLKGAGFVTFDSGLRCKGTARAARPWA
jgi:hypothetical protein